MEFNIYRHHNAVGSVPPVDRPTRKERLSDVMIRELQEGDLDAVDIILRADIVKAPVGTEEEESQFTEAAYYFQRMKDSVRDLNDRRYSVATMKDTVVGIFGYMGLGRKTGHALTEAGILAPEDSTAELVNFYVDPEHQNKGIGGKLWKKIHNDIEQEGYAAIGFLSTDRHKSMWKWYTEKQGYIEVGRGEHFHHPCSFFYKELSQQPSL
jgi:GNAT superfamily N-acetyltransferase